MVSTEFLATLAAIVALAALVLSGGAVMIALLAYDRAKIFDALETGGDADVSQKEPLESWRNRTL